MSATLELTKEEGLAIVALKRLAERWPSTLTISSRSGKLVVTRSSKTSGKGRAYRTTIVAYIDRIPTTDIPSEEIDG